MKVYIDENGDVRHVATDEFRVEHAGPRSLHRASHVEPWGCLSVEARGQILRYHGETNEDFFTDDSWFADLTPSEGPVLGPFDTRAKALVAELRWLEERGLKQNIVIRSENDKETKEENDREEHREQKRQEEHGQSAVGDKTDVVADGEERKTTRNEER